MNWIITIYVALLFFVLTPGVLVTLPPKSGRLTVAAFHALVFALVWHFTHKIVWKLSVRVEGLDMPEQPHTEEEKEKEKQQ
jgi:hypothetical protein